MKRVTDKTSESSIGSKMNEDLKCESCKGLTAESIPGEVEALLTLNDARAALKAVMEISERMDPSSLLDDTECGFGENRSEPDDLAVELREPINFETGLQVLESLPPGTTNGSERAVATEKLEIVASRIIKKYGKKSTRITLSTKADIHGKENEDKTGIAKATILTRENPPEENILTPINDSMRSHAIETHTETTKKKPWNFLKFLFGNKKRK